MRISPIHATNTAGGRRRGSILVLTLGAAMAVMVIGFTAVWVGRMRLREVQGARCVMEALAHARSAVELGLQRIRDNPDWRTKLGPGPWFTELPIGQGVCSLTVSVLVDGDADPMNDDWVFLGTGVSGGAARKVELVLLDGNVLGEWRQRVD